MRGLKTCRSETPPGVGATISKWLAPKLGCHSSKSSDDVRTFGHFFSVFLYMQGLWQPFLAGFNPGMVRTGTHILGSEGVPPKGFPQHADSKEGERARARARERSVGYIQRVYVQHANMFIFFEIENLDMNFLNDSPQIHFLTNRKLAPKCFAFRPLFAWPGG